MRLAIRFTSSRLRLPETYTANSSPPRRHALSFGPISSCKTLANFIRTSSPTICPKLSFTSLKLSRSNSRKKPFSSLISVWFSSFSIYLLLRRSVRPSFSAIFCNSLFCSVSRRILSILLRMISGSKGLRTKSMAPIFNPLISLSWSDCAVKKITGISFSFRSFFSSSITSYPFISGIFTSSRIKSGCMSCKRAIAFFPESRAVIS